MYIPEKRRGMGMLQGECPTIQIFYGPRHEGKGAPVLSCGNELILSFLTLAQLRVVMAALLFLLCAV